MRTVAHFSFITAVLLFSGCTARLTEPEMTFTPPKYVEEMPSREEESSFASRGSLFGQGDSPLFSDMVTLPGLFPFGPTRPRDRTHAASEATTRDVQVGAMARRTSSPCSLLPPSPRAASRAERRLRLPARRQPYDGARSTSTKDSLSPTHCPGAPRCRRPRRS